MSVIINDPEGNEVEVYVSLDSGRVGAMVRCADQKTFDAVAQQVGLIRHKNRGAPAILDGDGKELVAAVEPNGPLVPTRGVTLSRLGPITLQPAEQDEDGNETKAAVVDNRYHVNFWLSPQVASSGAWKAWAIAWSQAPKSRRKKNKDEAARVLNGIELINPATISSPSNVIL